MVLVAFSACKCVVPDDSKSERSAPNIRSALRGYDQTCVRNGTSSQISAASAVSDVGITVRPSAIMLPGEAITMPGTSYRPGRPSAVAAAATPSVASGRTFDSAVEPVSAVFTKPKAAEPEAAWLRIFVGDVFVPVGATL